MAVINEDSYWLPAELLKKQEIHTESMLEILHFTMINIIICNTALSHFNHIILVDHYPRA